MNALLTQWSSRFLMTLGFGLLAMTAQAQIATFGPPTVPNMDDAVLTAGTSVVGNDGQNWAYVVWNSPGQATLKNKAFAVYLQSTPGGPFTRQAIVSATAEPPAINLLLSRAANLHANNQELNNDLRDLLRRKSWAGLRTPVADNPSKIMGFDLQTSTWDSRSLQDKLSAVMGHALQSGEAAAAVQMIAPEHPALRMALGRAWAGPLPAGSGPMVIELREWTGADGGVIGRVSLTPGQGIALASPGTIVQVPDLKPSGDLTIKLRWAVPDPLRRQQQHVLGFRVFRIRSDIAQSTGLDINATQEQLVDWVDAHPSEVEEVNDAPVPIAKLFSPLNVGDFSPFTGDRTSYFVADNGNRGAPLNASQPDGARHQGFNLTDSFRYFVCAVDLLGRVGPPSPQCTGIPVRTVPPNVPRGLKVVDLPDATNTRKLTLSWEANSNAQPEGSSTEWYAIYRGTVPGAPGETTTLAPLEDPAQFRNQMPIAYVSQAQAVNGLLSYVDDVAMTPGNTDRSIWYAVTALHNTPLDWFAGPPIYFEPNPHERVQSAPTAPAFGVFRDRVGPPAPAGSISVNCDKLVCVLKQPPTEEPRTATSDDHEYINFRVVVTRPSPRIAGVRIVITDLASPPPAGAVVADSLNLLFPPEQNQLTYEVSLPESWANQPLVSCIGFTLDESLTDVGFHMFRAYELKPNASVWNRIDFVAGNFSLTDFASDSNAIEGIRDTATPVTLGSIAKVGPNAKQATVSGIPTGEFLITQVHYTPTQAWVTKGTSVVDNGKIVFEDVDSESFPAFYRAARVTRGNDGRCIHDARPANATTIQPITVMLTIPETTKEWRVFRSVDAGPLALMKSGIVDLNQGVGDAIIAQDKTMPPNGALMRYFGQCFDQNNNPSPLKFLGEVNLLPQPALPILSQPETENVANSTRVNLTWFCPTPGVKRFQIILHALTKSASIGKPTTVTPGLELVNFGTLVEGGAPLINLPYTLAGETSNKTGTIGLYYSFRTPEIAAGDVDPIHKATFQITPDVEYVAFIQVIGSEDLTVNSSKAYQFTWKPKPEPDVAHPEPLVPWPARPLPPVVVSPYPTPVQNTAYNFNLDGSPISAFVADRSAVSNVDAAQLYPVLVTIGVLPRAAEVRNDYQTDTTGVNPPIVFDSVFSQGEGDLDPDTPTDPANYAPGMLPCVLYRQTMLSPTKAGALVQVSPLRETIAWKREIATYSALGINYRSAASALRDPFIKVMTYNIGGSNISYLTLADTHSVEAGATYHYYLATYETNGELKTVYDCGEITIPED